jgi:hypothetical protein
VTEHVHSFEVSVPSAGGEQETTTLTVYVEPPHRVIAALGIDGFEIARYFAKSRGRWTPSPGYWYRRIGEEWDRYTAERVGPSKRQCRRASIRPHIPLVDHVTREHGLGPTYNASGPRRKLDASKVERERSAGKSDREIAEQLRVVTERLAKQRYRDTLSAAERRERASRI